MQIGKVSGDPRIAASAHGDASTLKAMQDAIRRGLNQGVLEAMRHARELERIDPDKVVTEVEKYFGAQGAWTDLLSDAFWDFESRSADEEAENSSRHWSEAGR